MSEATTIIDPLDLSISHLALSARTIEGLRRNHCRNLRDVVRFTERELLHTPNFGRKSLNELNALLTDFGLSLAAPATRRYHTLPLPFPSMHERLTRIEQRLSQLERDVGALWEQRPRP